MLRTPTTVGNEQQISSALCCHEESMRCYELASRTGREQDHQEQEKQQPTNQDLGLHFAEAGISLYVCNLLHRYKSCAYEVK